MCCCKECKVENPARFSGHIGHRRLCGIVVVDAMKLPSPSWTLTSSKSSHCSKLSCALPCDGDGVSMNHPLPLSDIIVHDSAPVQGLQGWDSTLGKPRTMMGIG